MFIAYLIPRFDGLNVYEDGLGFIAGGETREEAVANLRKQFDETYGEDVYVPGMSWDDIVNDHPDKSEALHVQEVGSDAI
jgi:hypothetical protein